VDNQSTIRLGENPEFYKRTKYIDIVYHFIKKNIQNNKIKILFIPSK
jgi:hypothetical protein